MGFITLMCPNCNQALEMDDSREFGFCQYCGTKVMQDKVVVQHTGSVKIDNKEVVEKFLANARRAKQKEDWEETEKYYNLVEQNDPTNIEAIFYSSYGKAMTSLIDSDIYKRQAAFKVLQNCVSILDDNFDMNDEEADKTIIKQISSDIIKICSSNYVYTQNKNGYGMNTSNNKGETEILFINLNKEFIKTLDEIVKKYPENDRRIIFYYELKITHYEYLKRYSLRALNINKLLCDIHKQWKLIDDSHIIPADMIEKKEKSQKANEEIQKLSKTIKSTRMRILILIVIGILCLVLCSVSASFAIVSIVCILGSIIFFLRLKRLTKKIDKLNTVV